MKCLVVGCGSVGKRHLQNLKSLGVEDLAVVESDSERRKRMETELAVKTFTDLADGLRWSPEIAIVATPTFLHVRQAIEIASTGCDLLIEKPLSHKCEGISELRKLVEQRGLVSMMGCNMRFHPGPSKVRELLQQGKLGRILSARIYAGSYLPGWRPGTDYRANYAAREETGGGCILDCIHEIDLARWYLGDVSEVFCAAGHVSSLEISTEDIAALICRHVSGGLSEIHLDYVQRVYERGCRIAGENGSVFWDFREGEVRWFDAASDICTKYEQPRGWQLNQMYLDEMKHFLDCVQTRTTTVLTIAEAEAVMAVAFAAKRSAKEGRVVLLDSREPEPGTQ